MKRKTYLKQVFFPKISLKLTGIIYKILEHNSIALTLHNE